MPKLEVQELPKGALDTRFLYPMPLPQKIVEGEWILFLHIFLMDRKLGILQEKYK